MNRGDDDATNAVARRRPGWAARTRAPKAERMERRRKNAQSTGARERERKRKGAVNAASLLDAAVPAKEESVAAIADIKGGKGGTKMQPAGGALRKAAGNERDWWMASLEVWAARQRSVGANRGGSPQPPPTPLEKEAAGHLGAKGGGRREGVGTTKGLHSRSRHRAKKERWEEERRRFTMLCWC